MREIKFRAWDKENKQWIEEFLITSDQDVLVVGEYETIKTGLTNGWKSSDGLVELQQYTGLKDKNGKEIYEGDILGGIWEAGYISWCDKCKQFQYFNCLVECMACEGDVNWYELVEDKELEVIGNIFENPELIN